MKARNLRWRRVFYGTIFKHILRSSKTTNLLQNSAPPWLRFFWTKSSLKISSLDRERRATQSNVGSKLFDRSIILVSFRSHYMRNAFILESHQINDENSLFFILHKFALDIITFIYCRKTKEHLLFIVLEKNLILDWLIKRIFKIVEMFLISIVCMLHCRFWNFVFRAESFVVALGEIIFMK